LLFLGAGAVAHATGTREIDRLGGLLKRMPWTAATFLVGAIAICGLPPLNGFVSEFLILLGALQGGISAGGEIAVPLLALIGGLGLIGGLAAACFTKAFGIVFLGEPRSSHTEVPEAGWAMRLPMLALGAACLLIGLLAPAAVASLQSVLETFTGQTREIVAGNLHAATGLLSLVVLSAVAFLLLLLALILLRRALLAGRRIDRVVTWDCGYARPTARMQYTASSFVQPFMNLFQPLLGTKKEISAPGGFFPAEAALKTETRDLSHEELYRPAFRRVGAWLSQLRWLQQGRVQLYILYIAVTLIVLLAWKFR
jgi:hydrogenase-4 component B